MDTRRPPPSPTYLTPRTPTLLLALCLSSLILPGKSEDFQLPGSPNDLPLQPNSLAVALGELLDYNQDRGLSLEKKASQLPRCDVGERCAMKHGPRIGKLCDCLRGASCSSFMLRCY
ncbi:cocaine- and amphetamine-regulated transcript protein-like [Aquarana catesbeiana]|uniref:cocaine- and amphetamine-regulated transcript protein-like n=1 Tax=Aquarana catesbeiana TaxID=8400 RepID=UPI003CC98749